MCHRMMASFSSSLGLITSFVGISILMLDKPVVGGNVDVDLRGDGCDRMSGFYIGDDDIANVFHKGSFNTIPTRDDCYVELRTDSQRRLEYIINDARFQQCGITITIYDSQSSTGNPKAIVDCNRKVPIHGKTNFNILRIHVRKATVSTDNFQFSMRIINDRGPDIFSRGDDANRDLQDALEPGVIIGIAIAGVILIIALVLLAIYLCIRARNDHPKNDREMNGESSVYTSGNSQYLFANKQYPKRRYGSTEDVRSTTSSKEKTNGAYSNTAYSADHIEKKSHRSNSVGRSSSVGRSRGKTGFTNDSFSHDTIDIGQGNRSWEEGDDYEVRIGSFRKSRIDSFKMEKKQLKSAMKKQAPPSEIEMSKVNTQPNSILKKNRTKSPNRSQTSSTEGSLDAALVYGYNRSTMDHPNVQHKPVLERRRSRSGTRSHRSGSSGGYSNSRRAHSADRKPKPKPATSSRMYGDVFIDDRDHRPRSNSRSRTRSRGHRGSDSVDSESSATSSRRVNMNPGGKRVHIKGEETDI